MTVKRPELWMTRENQSLESDRVILEMMRPYRMDGKRIYPDEGSSWLL